MSSTYRYSRRHRAPLSNDSESHQPFFSGKTADVLQSKPENTSFFQAKLSVGQPGDKYEQEADAVANRVVSGQENSPQIQSKEISTVQHDILSRKKQEKNIKKPEEQEEKPVQKMEKKEEEKPVQKMEKKEEEKPVQKMEKKEEEKPVQKMEKKEEEEPIQMKEKDEEEEPIQMKEEDEEEIQAKADLGSHAGSTALASQISNSSGNGKPIAENVRGKMENAFRVDLKGVNIHTDSQAVMLNQKLGAQAFTHGKDIYFNSGKYRPEISDGQRLLAHELTHVVQQGAGGAVKTGSAGHRVSSHPAPSTVLRQGLLDPATEKAAIKHNKLLLDLKSVMIVQIITATTVDGDAGPLTAEAIATFQSTNGLAVNGKVDDATLESLFKNRVAAGRPEHAIQLITDYYNLDMSGVLTIHFDPAIIFSDTTFQPGGMRVITLGPLAFLTALWLKGFIEKELLKPAPATPAAGPRPKLLSTAQEAAAVAFNLSKYQDQRAIRSIQGLVGSAPDGKFGGDTVERIAAYQSTNGIPVDGKAGEQTLRVLVPQLDLANQQDTAIRLIMDFYNMKEFGALMDIFYDPTLTGANAETPSKDIPGPDIIKVGPSAFSQGYAGLVHTIAHELEHIRQNKLGIADIPLSEFLGESVEIISKGMPDEDVAGFFNDAGRAIDNWVLMKLPDRKNNWKKFTSVRDAVTRRFNAATAAEKVTHKPTMDRYNAVAKPV
jgi:peptidoglycan hydrolase-like protein with peptidoglycan-binding domain